MPASPQVHISLPERYRVTGHVASGGMAGVWAAHDTLLDRPVAVKVLAEHLGADGAARERFQREARAAAGLSSHPHVVTIYDVGEHQGRSFIVMELYEGGTVADVIRAEGRVAPERCLPWLRAAADAIDAAHERGIVHRDIKPANLLLDDHERLAVADFGIARLAYDDQVTATGQVLGTAAYISPEQAEGRPATAASDRYALACVAFELLTGRRPFTGEHFAAQARAHIEEAPPCASELADALPRAIDPVLCRGLDKDPDQRWPSAVALVDALEKALGTRTPRPEPPKTAATVPLAGGLAAADGDTAPHELPSRALHAVDGGRAAPPSRRVAATPPTAPPSRRRSMAPVWAALGLLLLAAVAVIAALGPGGGGGGETVQDRPARESTPRPDSERKAPKEGKKADEQPEQAAAPAGQAETPAEPTPAAEPEGGDPAALNAEGYGLFQQGDYAGAVPYFQKAVDACGATGPLDPCGYAMFNLGASLNRSGNPQAAIPILEQRLSGWDNQQGVVKKELRAARAAAGQSED